MEFELIRDDDWREDKFVTVRMVKPSMKRVAAYEAFCIKTYDSLDRSLKWILDDPRGLRSENGRSLAVARMRDLMNLGLVELWAVDNGDVVGVAYIRRTLTEAQRVWGGNLNIVVREDLRKQGYGTEILRASYEIARRGIEGGNVLLTVDVANTAGWRTVRRATFDKVNVVQPKMAGAPKMVYRFTV